MLIDINKILILLLSKPRTFKTFIAITIDCLFCVLSVWFSYYLRLGSFVPLIERGYEALILSVFLFFPIFNFSGLYKSIFRYSGLYTLQKVSKAIALYGVLYALLICLVGIEGIPRTIGLIQPLLYLIFISFWRMLAKYLLRDIKNGSPIKTDTTRALVYGSGNAGRQLVRAMQESSEIFIEGFIDEALNQQGCYIDGKKIFSPIDLDKIIKKKDIKLILLALPSINRKKRTEIIKKLSKFKIAIRSIPGISDLAKGKSSITDLVELDIDDLLGRIEVSPFQDLMKKNIYLKNILVTGAGGSIGSELCRQIINLKPSKILLIEISEYALYSIHSELEQLKSENISIIPFIGSVQDTKRMEEIISIWKPATIFHAAAYKHVPIVESNCIEGIKNNFFGTYELAKISIRNQVSNFVFISTDKAVRPTNIMGATKRLAEISLQALDDNNKNYGTEKRKTKISIVRFGNVLDSSGSVIPKFRNQIKNGGPITLTHKEITRYFMTITEAAQLVIQSSSLAEGGDVFVLDMGKPIKIYDLAERMIELSGLSLKNKFNVKGDIEIVITGLRPGEKLYEELLLSKDPLRTIHPKIYRSSEPYIKLDELIIFIRKLEKLILNNDYESISKELKKIVNDYKPNTEIIDHNFISKKKIK